MDWAILNIVLLVILWKMWPWITGQDLKKQVDEWNEVVEASKISPNASVNVKPKKQNKTQRAIAKGSKD